MTSSSAVSRYMLVTTAARRPEKERAVVRRLRLVRVASLDPVPARPRTFEHLKRIYD